MGSASNMKLQARSTLVDVFCVLSFSLGLANGLDCIGCTSDTPYNSDTPSNPGCTNEITDTVFAAENLVKCNETIHTHCVVRNVVNTNGPTSWIRGCCKSGEGICSGTFHQEEPGVYDIWFNTCSEDLCNTMDPNTGSSGGGGNGGGGGNNGGGVIFVPPENSANNYRPSGLLAAMLVFVVTLAGFKNKGLL